MSDFTNADGVIVVASPSQDLLASALSSEAKRIKPESPRKARVHVAAEGEHTTAIRAALTLPCNKLIQVDIDGVVPQHKGRLERSLRYDESGWWKA